jgi:hypothetical protein
MTGNMTVGERRGSGSTAVAPGDRARLAWVGRRLRRVLDADRRRHVADARFCRLLADVEPERRPGAVAR